MRKITILIFTLLTVALAAPLSAANKDPNLKAIKARQSDMQLRSFNAGPLFGMAKGKIPYDAELASTLANNLKLLATMNHGRAWPKGSGMDNYDESDAKPEIWSTYPKVAEAGKKYATAVNELASAAGDGLEALRANIGALGKGCKGCHDDFRKKQ
jgi:cytochrome c556